MFDQAEHLRLLTKQEQKLPLQAPKLLMISSGKGGVGKSNLSLNFALALQQIGHRVLLIDADIGFANIDVLMGIRSTHHFLQMAQSDLSIFDVMNTGPLGLKFIAGGSGFSEISYLTADQIQVLINQMSMLENQFDYIVIDTGAGIQEYTLKMASIADDLLIVTTPEPTAITDAYALIKVLVGRIQAPAIRLVVNRVASLVEGKEAADKVVLVAKKFLNTQIQVLGYIYDDPNVQRAVMKQQPLLLFQPNSTAAKCMQQLIRNYATGEPKEPIRRMSGNSFINKMMRLFSK
ncbi:MinD/ParA family protein [Fodinisporobacter ferrooxydans]|uniref:MinD/ParA family protein n=1 Tax=Fodinisporobacter ferrooxydans TaxID=2901836 RepID=A0ABY4CH84_9BACL|nr:MinD/ParA family protein [Alicyclobacillaceae bacterium MYW30-H2]